MGKYSFVIKHEHEHVLDSLTDEQAGQLFKMIFSYSTRGEINKYDDPSVILAFNFMRGSLDAASKKYEEICKRRAEAAKSRWEKEKK